MVPDRGTGHRRGGAGTAGLHSGGGAVGEGRMPTTRERRRLKRTAMARPAGKEQSEGFCFFQRAMAPKFIVIVSLEPPSSQSSHFLATSRHRSPPLFKNSERDAARLPLAAPGRGRGGGDAGGGRPEGRPEPAPGLRRRPGGGAGAGPGDGVQAGVQGPVPLRAVRSRHQARRRRFRRDHHFLLRSSDEGGGSAQPWPSWHSPWESRAAPSWGWMSRGLPGGQRWVEEAEMQHILFLSSLLTTLPTSIS